MASNLNHKKLLPRPNYTTAIVSMSLVLFLFGFFVLLSTHTNELTDYFKEKINVIVELKDKATENDVKKIRQLMAEMPQIKESSIQFISKDEAAQILKEDFGEDFLLLDMPNPLFDVFTFNVEGAFLNKEELSIIQSELKRKSSQINDVYYQETMLDSVLSNVEKMMYFILILACIFMVIALILIHNSIKLSLYSNRVLIRNMELVGASWNFIRKPFMLKSMLHGLISGILACVLLGALFSWVIKNQPEIMDILKMELLAMNAGIILISGMLLTVSSTFIVITGYLKMRMEDLM